MTEIFKNISPDEGHIKWLNHVQVRTVCPACDGEVTVDINYHKCPWCDTALRLKMEFILVSRPTMPSRGEK